MKPACLALSLLLLMGCDSVQEQALFHPSHHTRDNGLSVWNDGPKAIGFVREASSPKAIWLMLHGNGGQAADRAYALPSFSTGDSVFILEYPGYGSRPGSPNVSTVNQAAREAYLLLRRNFPNHPICLVGESIGSGPACALAVEQTPPDKIVLITPFDELKKVAKHHAPHLPVGLLLGETWDNVTSLSDYRGPVDIFAAEADTIIPNEHAKALAASRPQAKFVIIKGGHNDWSVSGQLLVRYNQ